MQTYFIYALKNPETEDFFYVGQTCTLEARLKKHINDAKTNTGNQAKAKYISQLLADGKTPGIEILETLTFDKDIDWQLINDRENFFLLKYRQNITNVLHEDSDGEKCLSCGNTLPPSKGKRARIYCNDRCRVAAFNKKKNKDKPPRWISIEQYRSKLIELFSHFPDDKWEKGGADFDESLKTAQMTKEEASQKRAEYKLQKNTPISATAGNKTMTVQITSNSLTKHPLWKEGDPKEGSGGFYMKYGFSTYDEIEKSKTK